jgi:hypothetical protein
MLQECAEIQKSVKVFIVDSPKPHLVATHTYRQVSCGSWTPIILVIVAAASTTSHHTITWLVDPNDQLHSWFISPHKKNYIPFSQDFEECISSLFTEKKRWEDLLWKEWSDYTKPWPAPTRFAFGR